MKLHPIRTRRSHRHGPARTTALLALTATGSLALAYGFGPAAPAGAIGGATTERVSVKAISEEMPGDSTEPSMSADGRYVAFASTAQLVAGDTDQNQDVYVRDRLARTTRRVSLTSGEQAPNGWSSSPSISADGRYVAFVSTATNLTGWPDNAPWQDIFVRDLQEETTELVSWGTGLLVFVANSISMEPAISGDGRTVAFTSLATNLVKDGDNLGLDVFVRDLDENKTELVTVKADGPAGGGSNPAISFDGSLVAFESNMKLVASDANSKADVYLRDRTKPQTIRLSKALGGPEPDGDSQNPSITADGRTVAFQSAATNLVGNDNNGVTDVFVRDSVGGITRVNVATDLSEATGGDTKVPAISADGQWVSYATGATNAVPNDKNKNGLDIQARHLPTMDEPETRSLGVDGPGNKESGVSAMSADGRYVAFESEADDLVAGDKNTSDDVFVRMQEPPTVTAVTPAKVRAGGLRTLTVSGTGFTATPLVEIYGEGITVAGVTWLSAEMLRITLNIAPNAVRGPVGLGVYNPGGDSVACSACFSVASGYWMVGRDGKVYGFGDAAHLGDPSPAAHPVVDLEPTPNGDGYWVLDERGSVFAYKANHHGNAEAAQLVAGEKVTSISATPSGNGYWLFTTLGRVLTFGDALHHDDMSHKPLNGPVLDSVATPSGNGYYMVGSDGGVFAFGDAVFIDSMGGKPLNGSVQSLVPDPDGFGYWLVATDGGIFAFEAPFLGSMGNVKLNRPVTGMVSFDKGYLMVGEDGGIFNFPIDTKFFGSLGANPPAIPIVAVAAL